MTVLRNIIFWILFISFPLSAVPSIGDADFKSETAVDRLVEWEAIRLSRVLNGTDLEIKLLPDSQLGEKIQNALKKVVKKESDKKENKKLTLKQIKKFLKLSNIQLSEKEWKELLAVLRAHNEMLKTGVDYDTALNNLLKSELEGISANSRGGVGRVTIEDPKVRKALQEAYEKKFPGKKLFFENGPEEMKKTAPASELAKLFNEVPPVKGVELQNLLGDIRAQAPEVRGKNFLNEFREDSLDDQRFTEATKDHPFERDPGRSDYWANIPQPNIENLAPQNVTVRNTPPPAVDFRQPPSQEGSRISGSPGGGHSGGGSPSGGSGGRRTNVGGSAGGPNAFEESRGRGFSVPDDFFTNKGQLTLENAAALLSKMQEQNRSNVQRFSLGMKTEHQTSATTLEDGYCQITVVKKEKTGNRCQYKAATARHCLEGYNTSYRMTVENIANITNVGIDFAPGGQDAAILTLTTSQACLDDNLVPVLPIATSDIGEGEEILVAGRAVIAGRASPSEIPRELDPEGNSLVQLDVRQRVNGGIGIYQGDSGGGVVRVGQNGKMELVGVISSKLVDPVFRDGIGFMAAKSGLSWMRDMIGTPAEQQQQVAQARPAQDRTVPLTHAN